MRVLLPGLAPVDRDRPVSSAVSASDRKETPGYERASGVGVGEHCSQGQGSLMGSDGARMQQGAEGDDCSLASAATMSAEALAWRQ